MPKVTIGTFRLKPHPSHLQNVVNLFGFIAECNSSYTMGTIPYHIEWYTNRNRAKTAELNHELVRWVHESQYQRGHPSPFEIREELSPALIRHGYDGVVVSTNAYNPLLCWYFPVSVANELSQRDFTTAYRLHAKHLYSAWLNQMLFVKAGNFRYPPIIAHNWRWGETFMYNWETGEGLVIEERMKMHVALNALTIALRVAQRGVL